MDAPTAPELPPDIEATLNGLTWAYKHLGEADVDWDFVRQARADLVAAISKHLHERDEELSRMADHLQRALDRST